MATSGGGGGGFRCYYDVLEVGRESSQAELRRAYRRQALLWHPDKRQPDTRPPGGGDDEGDNDPAGRFHLVQKAYEILSDPRSRAWYDKHRDQILVGGAVGVHEGDSADAAVVVNVFEYFPPSCYHGYGDGAREFFGVYGRLFKLLAEEAEAGGQGAAPPPAMPEFGQSDSDYESCVGPFYARWERFASSHSQLPPRQRQRRSEEVRVLVAFVKAWDPRVFTRRAAAASDLLAGLAETQAVRDTVRQSALAGLGVGAGAVIGAVIGAALSRDGGGGFGLVVGAALTGVAYAVATRGSFESLADAFRRMPPERRSRLVDRTLETLREFNALETATWASLLATNPDFRSRLLEQLMRFAYGEGGEVDFAVVK